jgi:hypothetical protein
MKKYSLRELEKLWAAGKIRIIASTPELVEIK